MGIDAVNGPAIFLDRDGVLNRTMFRNGKPIPPQSLTELEILPGVPEALAILRRFFCPGAVQLARRAGNGAKLLNDRRRQI